MGKSYKKKNYKNQYDNISRQYRKKRKKLKKFLTALALVLSLFSACCPNIVQKYIPWLPEVIWHQSSISLDELPDYNGSPYVVINNNVPEFSEEEITIKAYESFGLQDLLGRCSSAVACIGKELMPTEERESISSVTPSGWQTQKYDFVDQLYLYNRCHLIGFQLTGENANERNLITGTRYMNVEGMLPFENQVAEYIERTGNHVMYRVTPIFEGANLVADGVQMEAYSVEDQGVGICFNVFVYNVQPGVVIDYLTGYSHVASVR